ncbi:hypothetical protein EDC04DRAFT_2611547 [Pisolithus marmoratus]|nr:hypothetical protein EDC04DRAFT_2611547 [Pisolithus marmoratus]
MPVSKLQSVPAFYDNKPHLLPLLTSQVELVHLPVQCTCITASESMTLTVLSQNNVEARAKTARATTPRVQMPSTEARVMIPRATTPRTKMPRVMTPIAQISRGQTPEPMGKQRSTTIENLQSDSEHSEGSPVPSQSSLSSLESELTQGDKNPKLSGEVGWPGCGGYNLEEQLNWGADSFKSLKQFVNKAIRKHLDTTKCQSQQDCKVLDTVCDLATAKFPDLESFEKCWPVLNLIQMCLKYLSLRAQLKKRINTDSLSEAAKGEKRKDGWPKLKSPMPSKK